MIKTKITTNIKDDQINRQNDTNHVFIAKNLNAIPQKLKKKNVNLINKSISYKRVGGVGRIVNAKLLMKFAILIDLFLYKRLAFDK